MMRSFALGSLAGLLVVALLMGVLAASNGGSEDLYAPLLVMGLPILVIGAMVGVFVGPGRARQEPRSLIRTGALLVALVVLATALRHMGVL
ncbi:hypothetical protein LWF15_09450 [Kineosporia rhizophila]|uniref:hypothetical protein n=1 Tax=Kineosporia rhizophila TaxID=84633 RepID=UPI000A98344C|nr:hypothetical protein [Kineosporia rhizophila]MCE0535738.1 hypothetical protein [Kineosporia rhizophila]